MSWNEEKEKQETNQVEGPEEGGHLQRQEVRVQGEKVKVKLLQGHVTNHTLVLQDHLTDVQLQASKKHMQHTLSRVLFLKIKNKKSCIDMHIYLNLFMTTRPPPPTPPQKKEKKK